MKATKRSTHSEHIPFPQVITMKYRQLGLTTIFKPIIISNPLGVMNVTGGMI